MRLLSEAALQAVIINMQKRYRRTPMLRYNFNNVALYYVFPADTILFI